MNLSIKYLFIDVDGTLTDGSIYYDDNGNELKKFNTRDGVGLIAAKQMGIEIVVITGRYSIATARRMSELKIKYLFQDIKNKKQFLEDFMNKNKINKNEVAYIGDDLNDYGAISLAGFVACPSDACDEIKNNSSYISSKKGGEGAVRDIVCHVLKVMGKWDDCIKKVHGTGI